MRPSSASSKTTISCPTSRSESSFVRISGLLLLSIRRMVLMESKTTTKRLSRGGRERAAAGGAAASGTSPAASPARLSSMSSAEARSIFFPSSVISKSAFVRSVTKAAVAVDGDHVDEDQPDRDLVPLVGLGLGDRGRPDHVQGQEDQCPGPCLSARISAHVSFPNLLGLWTSRPAPWLLSKDSRPHVQRYLL
jgi:hypothetical protein